MVLRIVFISLMTQVLSQNLPSSGQFMITKYSDSKCQQVNHVSLNLPNNPCWSSYFTHGIKATYYNTSSQELSFQYYNSDSCYSTFYYNEKIICDNTCQPYPQNNEHSITCSYVPFPSKANFTFERYVDSECTQQKGITILRGGSSCWKLGDSLSMTPIDFDIANIKDLTIVTFDDDKCRGKRNQAEEIKCNSKCFGIGDKTDEYYRCSYVSSYWLKANYFFIALGLYLILF